jgi:hypothetical protein
VSVDGARIVAVTSGPLTTATAFWSYAHSDDDGSDGQIRRLKDQVDHAFKRHSGETLVSFFDRHGAHRLEWGDEWRSKISKTISGTTFFIAVVSPSYLKSASCKDEFIQFWEKARASDLQELLLPILWVKVYPETEEEQQIWEIAQERQHVDWTMIRKLDEKSPEYTNLIDEMGERLAAAAREVSVKPEVIEPEAAAEPKGKGDDDGATADGGLPPKAIEPEGPPGLIDLHADAMSRTESFVTHLNAAFAALNEMQQELAVEPLHQNASAGQRLFYFKRIAKDVMPYAQRFEVSAKQAEEAARLLNQTMFSVADLLADPDLGVATTDLENLDQLREVPGQLAQKFGDYNQYRSQIATLGRMSRDLRVPLSSFERGFDSFDAIMELIKDWIAAFDDLGDDPPDNPPDAPPDNLSTP